MSKSREQLNDWLRKIDIAGKTVLDIGAGPKEKWAINQVRGTPKLYKTSDINSQFGCDYDIDLNKSYTTEVLEMIGKYDIVFCLETLEHVYNPIQAIKTISNLTGGVLYLSTPFVNPIHDTHDYLRYTFQWFERVLPRFGFKEVNVRPRVADTYWGYLKEFYAKSGMRMSKVTLKKGWGGHIRDVGYMVEALK